MLTVVAPSIKNGKPSARTLHVEYIDYGFDLPTLIIEEPAPRSKKVEAYSVEEFDAAADFSGRAFTLVRADKKESYAVLVSRDPRQQHCDCAGWAYGRGKPCKHITALTQLIASKTL